MATLDIRGTVVGETALAIKAPCLVATTGSNIALTGVQAIDGVTVGNNSERVLVKDQTTQSQNGIYIASTGPWVLAADFTSNNNITLGTLVLVVEGASNSGTLFEQTCTDNPIVIGTSLIAFVPLANATAQAATSVTSVAVGTGAQTFTIQAGKAFTPNQWLLIQESSNSANQMLGQIASYSGTTLAVNVVATGGSGTHSDWIIVLTNSPAAAGYQPPVGTGNVTGPGSSAAGHFATFSGTTGKVIQDGGAAGSLAALSSISAQYLTQSAAAFGINMLNGQVVASVASNALTFTVQTLAGNTPSSTDPVWFVFRSAAASSGALSVVEVTSALAVTVPASSTLGFTNSTPARIWLAAVNNSGSLSLGVINCLSGTSIFPLTGWGIASITAFGSGANGALTFYGSSSLSSVPYSVLGYATYETGSTLSTAGSWSAAPTRLETYRPGVPLPGQVIQNPNNWTLTAGTTTSSTFAALSSGQTQAITPTSSANLIRLSAAGTMGVPASGTGSLRFARGSTGLPTAEAGGGWAGTGTGVIPVSLVTYDFPASLTSITYGFQGAVNTGTLSYTYAAYGAVLEIQEIMA